MSKKISEIVQNIQVDFAIGNKVPDASIEFGQM